MRKPVFLLYLFLNLFYNSHAQADSCSLRISLLTCAPGDELYSTFGHTAIRVQDMANGMDLVFNYGTFEFGPGFYTKFIKGNLRYFLSVETFDDFMSEYREESRSVQEQVLQLPCTQEQQLFAALQINAQNQNRYYKYNFLFDNCTTRARDIIIKNSGGTVHFRNILPEKVPTFRQLIHSYLDAGHEYWSKLGIDILLGAKLDKKVSNEQSMFLPDYLLKGMDSAYLNKEPLVSPPHTILSMPSPLTENSLLTPGILFWLLLILIVVLSFGKTKWMVSVVQLMDFIFFLITGLAGVLILFMWLGTDHAVCSDNYNLLWALPTSLVMAFFVHKKQKWVQTYFQFVFGLSLLLLISWVFLPQQINNALIPIVIILAFRSRQLSKYAGYANKRIKN